MLALTCVFVVRRTGRGAEAREQQRGEQRHGFGELEKDPDGVHQQPAAGTGTGIRQQHVPVASQAHRDRQLSVAVRETGEDLVPEPAGETQEGGRPRAGRVPRRLQLSEGLSPIVRDGRRRRRRSPVGRPSPGRPSAGRPSLPRPPAHGRPAGR